jgi:hypothetical protein
MSAFESAIDDSFDPPPQPIEDEETDDESLFDNAYNGPRDGHWEVASSVGSYVDDRCPTFYGYRSQVRPAGGEARIDEGLVKKLMQATIERKRAEAAAITRQPVTVAGAPTDNVQIPSAPPSAKASRPFFVPPLRNKPYIPVVAKSESHREQSPRPLSTTRQPPPKANNEFRATETREVATPKAEVVKPKSHTSQRTTPDRNMVRILGKNGEEAFVSLPSLAKSVHASSHRSQQRSEVAVPNSEARGSAAGSQPRETATVPEVVENEQQDEKQNQEQPQQQKKKQKNKKKQPQDEVERLITESLPVVEREESTSATSWVMSGALPAPSREPSQAAQSAASSLRDSGIAISDFIARVKAASDRASSIRSGSAISPGVLSVAQQIAKMPSTISSTKNCKHNPNASGLEGFKGIGFGMTTGFPPRERTSDRSDHGRAKQPASSRHSSQLSVRKESGSVQQQGGVSSRHSSQSFARRDSGSVQQQHEGASRHGSQQSARRESSSVQQQYEGSSQHSSQPSIGRQSGLVQQQDRGSQHGAVRSNYKPPTVVSASSSASITHSFGGMYTEGFVPQDQSMLLRQEAEIGSRGGGSDRSRSVRSGSVRSSVKYASDVSSSKNSQSSSRGHRSDHSVSIRSHRGSSVQNGANYVSEVASLRHSQSGSQARCSDHSRSARSDRGSSVRSVASCVSILASSRHSEVGSRAPSVAHPGSDRVSQRIGTRCPSHSPVSPLAPSPHLFAAGPEQTRFAGAGWISPHPASVIPMKPAVYMSADSTGHCGALTYSEWRAHRDDLASEDGTYAGSLVPSAVGLQPLLDTVYSHPPPANYVGSHNPGSRQLPQPVPQMDGEPAWANQHFSPLQGFNEMQLPASVHSQQGSLRSHRSARSQSGSISKSRNSSLCNEAVRQVPIAASQNAGWSFPPQDNHSSPVRAPAYNVGLTPAELSTYQSQLGNTISHYSSQLSHIQREQTPPQSNYESWDSGQSHHSSRRSSSQHSIHNFPPNLSYPRVKSQLAMPWDATASRVDSGPAVPTRQVSSPAGSSLLGRHTASVGGVRGVESHLHSNASSSRGSVASRSSFELTDSQVTYGTVEWEKLENAEEGRGEYQAPQDYNMW